MAHASGFPIQMCTVNGGHAALSFCGYTEKACHLIHYGSSGITTDIVHSWLRQVRASVSSYVAHTDFGADLFQRIHDRAPEDYIAISRSHGILLLRFSK